MDQPSLGMSKAGDSCSDTTSWAGVVVVPLCVEVTSGMDVTPYPWVVGTVVLDPESVAAKPPETMTALPFESYVSDSPEDSVVYPGNVLPEWVWWNGVVDSPS